MTKLEALAKDCIENHTHRLIDRPSKQDIYTREESIYISGYKECERQNKNKIADLERKLEQTEKDLTDYQFNYPKIKDLEKENATLKKQLEALSGDIPWNELKDVSEVTKKLTEAKEIIKELLHTLKNEGSDYTFALENTHPVLAEAEQFLSEVEK